MILNRVYEDFISHTNLSDPVYKSVFQKLSDIITNINSIKWKRLIYNMNNQVYDIDFEVNRVLPSYIIDLFQNVFEHNFLFPPESTTIIQLDYKETAYEIRVENGITKIPSELNFLMYSKLFSFYYLSNPVDNIFDEFDNLFQIFDTFKVKPYEVYSSLKKRFDNEFIETNTTQEDPQNTYFEDALLIETLETKRKDLLKKLDDIQNNKEELLKKKSIIKNGVSNREKIINEQTLLKEEYAIASKSHQEYQDRCIELEGFLKELSDGIEGINESIKFLENKKVASTEEAESVKQVLEDYFKEKQYYIDKQLIFDKEFLSTKKMLSDSKQLLNDLQTRLTTLKNELAIIESYSVDEIDSSEKEFYLLNSSYEEIYAEVISLDHELKIKRDKLKKEMKPMASSLLDVNVQLLEKKDIIDHLTKPLKPQSIIVVENYLRYYFAYYIQKAVDVIEDKAIGVGWLNAIMSRKVLETYFGIQPYTLFSAIQFNPKSVKNFITVNRG